MKGSSLFQGMQASEMAALIASQGETPNFLSSPEQPKRKRGQRGQRTQQSSAKVMRQIPLAPNIKNYHNNIGSFGLAPY